MINDETTVECMLDIETLDTEDRSAILSIAAQCFTTKSGWQAHPPFVRKLDVDYQTKRLGRTVSLSTLNFWLRQDHKLLADQFSEDGRSPVEEALLDLQGYLAGLGPVKMLSSTVWANGPSFDCTNVGSLYRDVGLPLPWRYNAPRDMRTLREESGLPRDWQPGTHIPGQLHDPLYDCRWQIELVLAARRRIARAIDGGSVGMDGL